MGRGCEGLILFFFFAGGVLWSIGDEGIRRSGEE